MANDAQSFARSFDEGHFGRLLDFLTKEAPDMAISGLASLGRGSSAEASATSAGDNGPSLIERFRERFSAPSGVEVPSTSVEAPVIQQEMVCEFTCDMNDVQVPPMTFCAANAAVEQGRF